ncbi:sulfatase family protein [Saccharospirillum impatiens]|uniref:sulfatase family protein n=1 Tax=Saccharospirillum impatiens TaxID=169438 RepID=UPI00042A464C|nr:sulfatase-like hydrolase/transferase [Saccharospirillum impatiens]
MTAKRPNFILFMTDQHHADYLGCYGHPVLKTPNIDALAKHGTRFENFQVASPVCMPNRASLMTGRMPSLHGVRHNGIPLSSNQVTFVELLREAGYETALVGKSHLQNFVSSPPVLEKRESDPNLKAPPSHLAQAVRDKLDGSEYGYEQPGFWSQDRPQIDLPFYGFNRVDIVTGHGDGVGGDYVSWLSERAPNASTLIGSENQLPHDYQCPQAVRTALPTELYPTSYIAERARAFISEHDDETPFFLMVSFPDPHHPFNPPGDYWNLYSPEDMPVPEAFRRNDWTPPPHVQAVFDSRTDGRALLNGMNSLGISEREACEARALTCGMIALVDDAVGQVMAALEEAGLAEETVTMFTADHGDHLGEHRLLLKGAEQYRDITRVPFIWSEPSASARTSKALGSTLDIAASILDRAGLEPYSGIQGQSLLPVIEGRKGFDRNALFVQFDHQRSHPGLSGPPRVHSLITDNWRLSVFHNAQWGELYDLKNDPGEFHNLWDNPSYSSIRSDLMECLVREEIACVDRVPLPTSLA